MWAKIWQYKLPIVMGILILLMACGLGVLGWKLWHANKANDTLYDQLEASNALVMTGETTYRQIAIRSENLNFLLEERNKQLEATLQSGEKVVFLTQTEVVYRPVKVEVPGETTVITQPANCDCSTANLRVDFEASKSIASVKGFTTTNPSSATLEWQFKPLELDVAITRKDKHYSVLFDTHDPDITIHTAKTIVDPSAIAEEEKRWLISAALATEMGNWTNLAVGASAGYLTDNWFYAIVYQKIGVNKLGGNMIGANVGRRL